MKIKDLIVHKMIDVGRKGPLEVIRSNSLAHSGPPEAACPVPCPDSFWRSPRRVTPQHFSVTCAFAQSSTQRKKKMFRMKLSASICPLSWH